jgi:hypothetical protein
MLDQQRKTQVHRKKDGRRKPEAEENQGLDMTREMGKEKNRSA